MEELTANLLNELREALASDQRVLALSEAEQALSSDEEARNKKLLADQAEEAYENAMKLHGQDSPEAKEALHELYLAKKALDELPVSLQYNKCFQEVRRLYDEIDGRVLGPFRSLPRCKGGER